MTAPLSDSPPVRKAITDLAEEFAGVFARETIARYVNDSQTQLLTTARIQTFIPRWSVDLPASGSTPSLKWREP